MQGNLGQLIVKLLKNAPRSATLVRTSSVCGVQMSSSGQLGQPEVKLLRIRFFFVLIKRPVLMFQIIINYWIYAQIIYASGGQPTLFTTAGQKRALFFVAGRIHNSSKHTHIILIHIIISSEGLAG